MGESIAEPPMVEDKMRGSINNSGSPLEVSVSFGRFESDSLSWEKWSSFSPNKYLEEVEKCATPGSVAQKKAYFEAHYKKIAARKIEELEKQKQDEAKFSNNDGQNGEDHVDKPHEYDDKAKHLDGFQISGHFDESNEGFQNDEDSVEKPYEYQTKHVDSFEIRTHFDESNESLQNGEDHVEKPYEYQVKHVDSFQISSHFDESNENSTITIDSHCSMIDEIVDSRCSLLDDTKEEKVCGPIIIESREKEELVSVLEETQINVFQEEIKGPPAVVEDKVESRRNLEKEKGKIAEKGNGKTNLGAPKKSPKMAHLDKQKTLAATKKKPLPRLRQKNSEISTPKTSKPISSSSMETPSRSSAKKTNFSSLQKSKNVGEIKKIAPSSLHMSLSLGPANDDSPSLPTNRKSLIMEKMGDKDIVKRAFKSFQNSFNQGRASEDPSSSAHNEALFDLQLIEQALTSRPVQKVSNTLTLQKEHNGIRRGEKMDVQRAQLGRSLNFTVNGSPKGANMDQRRAKPAPSSFGVRSDEKRKNISKKSVDQVSAKESERERLVSKSREKEAEIKKFRQNLNFKATPMPSFYRGHSASKSSSTKEGELNHTPVMRR